MIRPAIVLLLLLSAAFMMRGLAEDWRKNLSTPVQDTAKKAIPAGEAATVAPLPQAKALQPEVPEVLPDLKDGYLFNQERMLAGAETPPATAGDAEAAGEMTSGIAASIDDVIYTGSIITDADSRAIITYPSPAKNLGRAPAASRPPKSGGPVAVGPVEYGRLAVGDVLDGYEVKEILPERLIFTKGEETVEKMLYDPDKNRQAPPPRPKKTTLDGSPMPPTGTPAPEGVKGGIPPAASTPVPPQGVTFPPGANTEEVSPMKPTRRMTIPRQRPGPGPDLRREGRQSTEEGGAISLPPGGNQ